MSDILTTHSYVPYSQNPGTCIIESRSGKFYAGVRIENISYPLTIPAIQAAITICLSEGESPSRLYIKEHTYEQLDYWKSEFDLSIVIGSDIPTDKVENLLKNDLSQLEPSKKLKHLLSRAVVPNSDFQVAALLFTKNGYFEGVNVEVSEWTKGLCAERVALSKAIAAGYAEFDQLEVLTKKGQVSSPCGSCRQVISEFMPTKKIVLHHADNTVSEHFMNDLLPFNFTSDSLKK